MSRRLEELNREILSAWLSRNLRKGSAPSSDLEASAWFVAWDRLRNGFIAHSEAFLLDGILTPAQAESFLMSYWRSMGLLALADPEMALQLKLSRAQRSEIAEGFIDWLSVRDSTTVLGALVETGAGKLDEWGRNVSAVARQEKAITLADADWAILGVLTPWQRRKLNQVIGIKILEPPSRDQERGIQE